jgi:tetratricopeptide (TPR) repeat protein
VTPTAPEDRFSTARSPGDRVGPVRLVERLPAPPTEERWRATVQLAKGPPREVVAVATAAPTGGPALERWQESDGGWSATVVTSEPPPEETPGPSGPDAADVPDPAAATALGHAWLALGDGDLDRAIDLTWAATERVGRARRRYSAPLVEALAGRVGDEHPESAVVGLLRAGDLAEGGRSAEALATARAALGRRTTHAEVRGRLHYLAAVLSHRQGHLDEVEADARRAVALLDEAGAPRWAASACTALAVWAQARGDFALADEVYGGALERARRAGSREAELVVYSNRAGLLRAMGRWEDARTCLLANLSLARQLGAKASVLVALSNLAGLLLDAGQPRAARARCEEAVALAKAVGRRHSEALARLELGRALVALGLVDRAEVELRAAAAAFEAAGSAPSQASARNQLADLLLASGRLPAALAEAQAVEALGEAATARHRALARWFVLRADHDRGEPARERLAALWAAADAVAGHDRAAGLHAAARTAALAVRELGPAGVAHVERLRDRIEAGGGRVRDRLGLAASWLDVARGRQAAEELARVDASGLALDERLEVAALRARALLATRDVGAAATALADAEALVEAMAPDAPVPTALDALRAATTELDAALAACPVRGGHHLLRLLGEGGQGRVWEAVAADGTRRVVALKELTTGGRLEREARLGGRLRHRHLVDVYGVGVDDGVAWCAMERCDGSLTERLPLPPRAVVEVGLQVCEALAHANEVVGLVHLDLKPDNLLLAGGVVKVADLGIAAVASDGHRRAARGTRGYTAPEQWAGRPVDRRTDVFALGVTLAELATARHTGSSQTFDDAPTGTAELALHEATLRTGTLLAPDWLAAVVARCTADDPADRFQHFAALAAALRALPVEGPGLAEVVGSPAPPLSTPQELVGRRAESAQLHAALDAGGLTVLEGPAGVGKTALARVALARRRSRRGERDLEVPVDALRDPAALRAALEPATLAALGDGVVLLDGVTGPWVGDVVREAAARAPDVRWLLTSRLAWPRATTRLEVPPLDADDGHDLVVARAAARGVREHDSAAIGALVRRLGGLPLALELAAGRLGVFTAAELVERLDLTWLRGGHVDLEASLREAARELSAVERALLAALAAAPGGLCWADLPGVVLPGGASVLPVLDDLLARSVVGISGDRFTVPEVLAWTLRDAS